MKNRERLFNRNFFLLWQGQLVSMIGTQVFSIGMIFWIKHNTNSASLMGLLMMVSSITGVLLTIAGGIMADRYDRRRIIVWSDALSGLAVLLLGALIFLMPGRTELVLAGIFLSAVLIATLSSFSEPSITAAIPDLVPKEKLNGANSMSQLSMQLSVLAGQGIGGILFRFLGIELLVLINAVSYLYSAFSESFMSIPTRYHGEAGPAKKQLERTRQDLTEGFSFIWERRGLKRLILLSTFLNLLIMPVLLLLPFYIEDHLRVTAEWYGFILASFSAGSLLGYLFAGIFRFGCQTQRRVILLFMILEPLLYALLSLLSSEYLALAFAGLAGLMRGYITVNIISILQLTTPCNIRGRVIGFMSTLSGAMAPLGAGLAGVIFDFTGHNIQLIYLSCALLMLAVTVLTALSRDFRKYLEFSEETPSAEYSMAESTKV